MCLTENQFILFINTIKAPLSQIGDSIFVIHATEGNVLWIWDGISFCMNSGVLG